MDFQLGLSYDQERRVSLKLLWTNQREETVATGSALVVPPPKLGDVISANKSG